MKLQFVCFTVSRIFFFIFYNNRRYPLFFFFKKKVISILCKKKGQIKCIYENVDLPLYSHTGSQTQPS